MIKMNGLIFFIMALCIPGQVYAEWHEASSDNFLVIADQNEKDTREFAERLERFHTAMYYILGRETQKVSPSNRLIPSCAEADSDLGFPNGGKSDSMLFFIWRT